MHWTYPVIEFYPDKMIQWNEICYSWQRINKATALQTRPERILLVMNEFSIQVVKKIETYGYGTGYEGLFGKSNISITIS